MQQNSVWRFHNLLKASEKASNISKYIIKTASKIDPMPFCLYVGTTKEMLASLELWMFPWKLEHEPVRNTAGNNFQPFRGHMESSSLKLLCKVLDLKSWRFKMFTFLRPQAECSMQKLFDKGRILCVIALSTLLCGNFGVLWTLCFVVQSKELHHKALADVWLSLASLALHGLASQKRRGSRRSSRPARFSINKCSGASKLQNMSCRWPFQIPQTTGISLVCAALKVIQLSRVNCTLFMDKILHLLWL